MKRLVLRFSGEAVLIVVSVFVAILLESMWQDHREANDARESLAQVRMSLAEDLAFFDRVDQEQADAEQRIQNLIQWFADPQSLPNEQVHAVFVNYEMPVSIWARRAAWDTMVSAGQLRLLNAPELTTRIGDYYEHHLRRIEYNGRQYDDTFVNVFESDIPSLWDFEQGQLLTSDSARLTEFRNRLIRLNEWTQYYMESVERNRVLLEALIADIDIFLG